MELCCVNEILNRKDFFVVFTKKAIEHLIPLGFGFESLPEPQRFERRKAVIWAALHDPELEFVQYNQEAGQEVYVHAVTLNTARPKPRRVEITVCVTDRLGPDGKARLAFIPKIREVPV